MGGHLLVKHKYKFSPLNAYMVLGVMSPMTPSTWPPGQLLSDPVEICWRFDSLTGGAFPFLQKCPSICWGGLYYEVGLWSSGQLVLLLGNVITWQPGRETPLSNLLHYLSFRIVQLITLANKDWNLQWSRGDQYHSHSSQDNILGIHWSGMPNWTASFCCLLR